MEGHGARVPDQDCLEYGRIADIGNQNDFTKRVFHSTGWHGVRCPDTTPCVAPRARAGAKARLFGHLGYSPGGGRVISSGSKMTLRSPFSTNPTSVS